MQQYYIDFNLDSVVTLTKDRYKYLAKVVKVKVNDEIYLFNGVQKAIYKIVEITNSEIILEQKEMLEKVQKNFKVTLAIGLLKKTKLEWVIQKVVELGIDEINLVSLQNDVVKFDNKADKKIKRYKEIILSACEQSKRDTIPKINYIDSLKNLNLDKFTDIVVAHEKVEKININKTITSLDKDCNVLLIVGAEGGIAPNEIAYLEEYKTTKLVSLGKNILKSETAAIVTIGNIIMNLEERYPN